MKKATTLFGLICILVNFHISAMLAQSFIPPQIIGLANVSANQQTVYQLQGKNIPKGIWQIEPSQAAEIIGTDTTQTLTVIWENYCSHPHIEWSAFDNPEAKIVKPIEISFCEKEKVNCTLQQQLQEGCSQENVKIINDIFVRFACDTSNQLLTKMSISGVLEQQIKSCNGEKTKWFFQKKEIGKGRYCNAILPSGKQQIEVELRNNDAQKIKTISFEITIPTNNFLRLNNFPFEPICNGKTLDVAAISNDERKINFTYWQMDEQQFWFNHLHTTIKTKYGNTNCFLQVVAKDEYGCLNEQVKQITVSNGNGLAVQTSFDRTLPDSTFSSAMDTVGIIKSLVFGGTKPYNFNWIAKDESKTVFGSSPKLVIHNTAHEYYQLKITDKYGCEAISNFTMNPIVFRNNYRKLKSKSR